MHIFALGTRMRRQGAHNLSLLHEERLTQLERLIDCRQQAYVPTGENICGFYFEVT